MFFARNGRDLPLPEPVLLVRSLLARWNAHAPTALQVADDDARALVSAVFLDEVSGATERVELGSSLRQVGFVGEAELRLLRSAPQAAGEVFGALMRFAELAGVGAQTTCGFGAVEVTLPDRPPVRRPAGTRTKARKEDSPTSASQLHQLGPTTAATSA
jgi:CRISPR-associated endoribonuclease Cas6